MMFQTLQYCLSSVGVVALVTLLYRWVSRFHSAQKELSQVDREVKASYRELIESIKEQRNDDMQRSNAKIGEIVEQLKRAEQDCTERDVGLSIGERRDELIARGLDLVVGLAGARQNYFMDGVRGYCKTMTVLMILDEIKKQYNMSRGEFYTAWNGVHDMFKALLCERTLVISLSNIVPLLLEDFDSDPTLPISQYFERLKNKLPIDHPSLSYDYYAEVMGDCEITEWDHEKRTLPEVE